MLLYDVTFVWQVLTYMRLQNLKTEVDQSLEPGRHHRANEKNLLQAAGNTWEKFMVGVQSSCDGKACIQETT